MGREVDQGSLHPCQIIQCELKMSNARDGRPTGYFDKSTWFRSKIDYLRLIPKEGGDFVHVVDYKDRASPQGMGWHPTDVKRVASVPVVQASH